MIRFQLAVLLLFRPVFKQLGVPFAQLKAIVGTKLLMDTRRTGAFTSLRQTDTGAAHFFGYVLYLIMGGLFGFLLAIVPSTIVGYGLFHMMLMFFVALILISDYSSVILDTSDNTIILPRPVSSKTLLIARITHIVLYLGQYFVCLAAIPIIVSFVKHGWLAGAVNLIAALLSVLFAFAATGGLYLVLLRFFREERLKSVINVFQIFTTIFVLTSYQILPRLLNMTNVKEMLSYLPVWSLAVPPLWMAGAVTALIDQPFTLLAAVCSLLAAASPFGLIWLSSKYLAPVFAARLADLGTSSVPTEAATAEARETWVHKIARAVTAPGPERAAFQLVSHYFRRDRKLKLRIYPSIGYFAVMAVVFFVRTKGSSQTWAEFFQQLPQTQEYLIALYLAIFIVFGAAFEIFYSDEFKAAWVFYASPVRVPGSILLGTVKAVIIQFFLPFYAGISLLILVVWQLQAVSAVLVALLVSVLIILLISFFSEKNLPISLQPSLRNQGSNVARAIMALILIAVLAYAHYVLAQSGAWQWLLIPVLLAATIFLAGRYARISWARIRQ